jgi:hypothetical protein
VENNLCNLLNIAERINIKEFIGLFEFAHPSKTLISELENLSLECNILWFSQIPRIYTD